MRQSMQLLARAAIFGALVFCLANFAAAADPGDAARQVDRLLAKELPAANAAAPASDETFVRRVYLDIAGKTPTPAQVTAFVLDPADVKRSRLVDGLLDDESFGANWAAYWRDVVFYRRSEDRALIAAGPMAAYLAEQLNDNQPWDAIAASFITAEGDVQENGATALIMAQAGRPEETVAEISRIFMGIQIQCAQCHDHPTDRWKREQFHELAAFFPRVAARPQRDGQQRSFIVSATDIASRFQRQNANNRFRGTLEHRMPDLENPSEPGEVMQPVLFVTGQQLVTGTRDAHRRKMLAAWMTAPENPWFAAAFVNRMWAELVGEGFYEPVDDLGPDRQCSAPKTMHFLAGAFAENDYDVKWLFRAITATEAYQRQSRGRRSFDETPYAANCNQRLRGDQLYAALDSVLDFSSRIRGRSPRGAYGARFSPQAIFNQTFGYDPSEPRDQVVGSIPQALFMMNSPLINGAISSQRGVLGRLLQEIDDDRELVLELYLKSLSRQPTDDETATCLAYIGEVGNRGEAFEDILWALVNSAEFRHRK